MKKAVLGLPLMLIILFSATIGSMLVNLATANPALLLPYITIKSDGSVEPQTEFIRQNGNVYTLTSDLVLNYAVKIQRSNIIFDGGGHVIDGSRTVSPGYTSGLVVEGVTNVTVKNIEVVRFLGPNIVVENVSRSVFLRVKTKWLDLRNSDFNTIVESTIGDGITPFQMSYSNNNTIIKNNISFLVSDFSYNNTWDNGSVGNYWSWFKVADANGDGIGDKPYVINSEDQDRFPLMNPWDPARPFDTVPPRISILSPENKIYNDTSVPLVFAIYEPSSSMSYSLDGRDNVTIAGNTTLSGLQNGSYNLTVYVTDRSGNLGVSEIIHFSIDVKTERIPIAFIAASIVSIAVIGLGLLVYYKKRVRKLNP